MSWIHRWILASTVALVSITHSLRAQQIAMPEVTEAMSIRSEELGFGSNPNEQIAMPEVTEEMSIRSEELGFGPYPYEQIAMPEVTEAMSIRSEELGFGPYPYEEINPDRRLREQTPHQAADEVVSGLGDRDRLERFNYIDRRSGGNLNPIELGKGIFTGAGNIVSDLVKMAEVLTDSDFSFDDSWRRFKSVHGNITGKTDRYSLANELGLASPYLAIVALVLLPIYFKKKPPKKTFKSITADAGYGKADSQYRLGMIYFKGKKGVLEDFEEAAQWIQKAAMQGHTKAQDQLGLMYMTGSGVEKNISEAYAWALLCAQAKQVNLKNILSKKLSTEQKTNGQNRAKELSANITKELQINT